MVKDYCLDLNCFAAGATSYGVGKVRIFGALCRFLPRIANQKSAVALNSAKSRSVALCER